MCFTIPVGERERIATENIPCYKLLKRNYNRNDNTDNIIAPYAKSYIYFPANYSLPEYKAVEKIKVCDDDYIEEGLHSYSKLNLAKGDLTDSYWCQPMILYNAYIPKGAKFWQNKDTGVYVSNELVILTKEIIGTNY